MRAPLLDHFAHHARPLPWRGAASDPYRTWIVETMSQQTRIDTVAERLGGFLARFPDVATLAAAPRDDVMAAWAGLGYYRRARALHEAAQRIVHAGWPSDEAAWRALPGVGAYTAATLTAALGGAAIGVDGNVRRVGRRYLGDAHLPDRALRTHLEAAFAPATAPVGEALIELGATLCTPRHPACGRCPLAVGCAGARAGDPSTFDPLPRARRTVHLSLHAHLSLDAHGRIALERRPPGGLWGGLIGPPWREEAPRDGEAIGRFVHLLTHRRVDAVVHRTPAPPPGAEVTWVAMTDLAGVGLARIDQRALAHLG